MIRLSPITPFMLPSSHTLMVTWCTTLISLPKSSQQNLTNAPLSVSSLLSFDVPILPVVMLNHHRQMLRCCCDHLLLSFHNQVIHQVFWSPTSLLYSGRSYRCHHPCIQLRCSVSCCSWSGQADYDVCLATATGALLSITVICNCTSDVAAAVYCFVRKCVCL